MERYKQRTKHGRTTEKVARFWQGKENEARTKHEKTPKFYPSVKDPTAKKNNKVFNKAQEQRTTSEQREKIKRCNADRWKIPQGYDPFFTPNVTPIRTRF